MLSHIIKLGRRLFPSQCVIVTNICLCAIAHNYVFINTVIHPLWNEANCIHTNIFKVYEVSEESTTEEKVFMTHPQKTKPKLAKGI